MKNALFVLLAVIFSYSSFGQVSQNSLDFDGTNDYVQTSYTGISGSSARTVEAWIKRTANSDKNTDDE